MLQISDLRCEHAINPLGIDTRQPRFSWRLAHPERGQIQSAYQVLVASSPEMLASGRPDLWDSDKTAYGLLPLIEYGGVPLASRQRAYWRVRAWDRLDRPGDYSEVAWFEMGLLEPEDWHAQWIGFPAGLNGRALYFRDLFHIEQAVTSARAYVCGLGWHELHLNGIKVGDRVLEPAQTEYSRRVLYTTYDVTDLLHSGSNVVGAVVGAGWHGTPRLLAQLEIRLADGTLQRVLTGRWHDGGSWWRVADGPIVAHSLFDGETYDARLDMPGWDTTDGFSEALPNRDRWAGAMVVDPPGGRLVASMLEPVRVVETRAAVALAQPKPGIFVYDVGQNLAGWARLHVQGTRGTAVSLRFAESLYEDGTVNQENLRAARACDVYILKGEGAESWEPCFTYHGFRYVQVEGYPGEATLDSLDVRVVRSDVAASGYFQCDHPLINRIHRAVWWTEASNLHGVPTDCPQRDERMGWLNDMAARSEEALLNFDLARLLTKWLNDIADTQDERGAIADTAPFRWGSRPGDPVVVCYLLIPWLLYNYYGDRRPLEDHYEGMRRWVDFLTSRAEGHIVSYGHIGDWAPPIAEGLAGSIGSSAIARNTPTPLVSTAFYAYAVKLLAKIAAALDHEADAAAYRALFGEIQTAFNTCFWGEAIGGYGTNNQACNTLALYIGLVPQERQARVMSNIVADLKSRDTHLTTGNLTTKYILEILTDAGHGDLAFALASQTTYPSWGYMIEHGATTIWERWEQATGRGMNSHNHPMYGSVDAWFYRALAGIRVCENAPGFGRFAIRPLLPEGLTQVNARLQTVRGEVESAWERVENSLRLTVRIPVGSQAEITLPHLPGGSVRSIFEGNTQLWLAGSVVGEVMGVQEVRAEDERVVLLVGSGEYHFRVEA